ncbi:hypothetical protein ADK61_09270 [Streptomyces sp. XY66]|uniref:hypothetical protein n=1 Tax=Streptomyces sp. XY66 TaxID=1415563 RepID=UPI0006AEEC9F|nr:hypothetical protein [Streptomyces sp. XY66]KOU80357.1 hypothetical protein ADK61_09270 [Streptomyces sp. XY66]
MITIRRTKARRPAPADAQPKISAQRPWTIPTADEDDPGREAYALLGSAWRSSTIRLIETGRCFDVILTPQQIASLALDQLRSHGEWRGAVSAEGSCWNFYVPLRSGALPWPPWATYLSGPMVQIPPRAARDERLSLRWISRGDPTGRLLTAPAALCPILTALTPPDPRSGP